MKNSILKSTLAILAGFVLGAVLSLGTDFLLNSLGIMSMQNFKQNSTLIVALVVIYRFVFNVMGCYLTAKLAPNKPMKHVIIIGIIGTVLSIAGAAAMWDQALPWYNIAIIVISLPSAWLGGKLYLDKKSKV
ncbi:hypothetical protein EGI26_19415 [Lacihabitans sp. CCS-44]|uniref:hypothetical protein n=1 Tax=Lacihabitans sp. CCS-44 TaxID=2487331 RepID=UPI0020CB8B42|nr:hypothetical protein [Lacihabitans sp. CCS-44]MCP9757336.1 hypothetical protein [Lacihabitans sp. CCS-44]